MRIRHTLLLALLLLTSCITVGSFGPYWNSGKVDKALAGKWESARADKGGKGIEFLEEERLYRMHLEDGGDDKFVRTLTVNDSTFLMTKKHEDDEGGTLIAYVIQGDALVFFAPNRDKNKDFIARYPGSPFRISKTSFSVEALNPNTMKWLQKIASEPEWWIEIQRYTKEFNGIPR